MGTSCVVRFANPDAGRFAQVYKHFDGEPEQMVEALQTLRTVLIATNCVRGPTYAAAQFIVITQMQGTIASWEESHQQENLAWVTELDQPSELLGLGVMDSQGTVPPDVKYLYELTVPDLTGTQQWQLKISPELDLEGPSPIFQLFRSTDWETEGSLRAIR